MSTLNGRDGSLWVGTFDGGLNRVFQGHTTVYNSKNGLNSDLVLSLMKTAAEFCGSERRADCSAS